MRKCGDAAVTFIALSLVWFTTSVEAQTDKYPRLPESLLLLGYPPFNLFATTEGRTRTLQADDVSQGGVVPSISANGSIVASAHNLREPLGGLTVGTYSMADHKWTNVQELVVSGGSVAISPDGSQIACFTRKRPDAPSGLRVLNLRTGKVVAGLEMPDFVGGRISWAPDGRRIVFARAPDSPNERMRAPFENWTIYILEVETGTVRKIGDGMSPSWSPSGEWIAVVDFRRETSDEDRSVYGATRIRLMHPDGTGSRALMKYNHDLFPVQNLQPAWSPDSKALLFNRSANWFKYTFDVYLLDIATLKVTRKFKNTPPVYAWVAAK